MLANKLLSCVGGEETLYSDSVFSAYTYVGNGATQTITNGIDLAGKGGLVWTKSRGSATTHRIFDTTGRAGILSTDTTNGQNEVGAYPTHVYGLSNGYMASSVVAFMNGASETYVSWTFAKSPKFFDVVTYTGDGISIGRTLAHSLGSTPGMILVKATSATSDWYTWHRGTTAGNYLKLNTTDAQSTLLANTYFGNGTTTVDPTASNLTVGLGLNMTGVSYVAYLFAHDTSTDGIVQCGSFTTDGSGNATVNLGWEPQFLITKGSSMTESWFTTSVAQGMSLTKYAFVTANSSSAEFTGTLAYFMPNATGFSVANQTVGTYIYLAIRRPNKPPTVGTQVYNAIARTGTGAAATVTGVGFAPDLHIGSGRTTNYSVFEDRLRGATKYLHSMYTQVETADANLVTAFNMDGVTLGTDGNGLKINSSGEGVINHFFKRAVGVFDQVCYTGTGVAKTEAHGLGVVPELIIVKARSVASNWRVYDTFNGATKRGSLNDDQPWDVQSTQWNDTPPTSSVFTIGTSNSASTVTYVAYLFATKAGISSCFSYTGNGTSQTINCGFTTGARYVLVKSTSATGNWNVGDSTRGLSSGTDPLLYLNSTAAEITTDDWLDPDNLGFVVNETTNAHANVNGVTYIGLAFA